MASTTQIVAGCWPILESPDGFVLPDHFLIKRRRSGSIGPPNSLLNGELAFNEVDDGLYYGSGIAADGRTAQEVVRVNEQPRLVPLVPFVPDNFLTQWHLVRQGNAALVFPATADELVVYVNGFVQHPGLDFTLLRDVLVFAVPPTLGSSFYGVWLPTATSFAAALPSPIDGGVFPAADDAGPAGEPAINGGIY